MKLRLVLLLATIILAVLVYIVRTRIDLSYRPRRPRPSHTFFPLSHSSLSSEAKPGPTPSHTFSPLSHSSLSSKATPVSSCCSIAAGRKLADLCPSNEGLYTKHSIYGTCSCTDYILCKLVMVIGFSGNHFEESKDYFGSVHAHLPHTRIIVYDIGLTASQSRTVKSYCNAEVRTFNFSKYPPHTKNLGTYAWKPYVIKEVSEEFEVFTFFDASIRIGPPFIHILPNLLKFPLLPCSRLDQRAQVFKTTHDGMLKYFKLNMSREKLASLSPTYESGSLIFWANDFIKQQFLPKYVDCAAHIECIAPKGATVWGCNLRKKVWPRNVYAGCHRFDQSALNAILYRYHSEYIKSLGRMSGSCGITCQRKPTTKYAKSLCINN